MLDNVNTSMKKASHGSLPGQPAELADLARVVSLVEHAHQREQGPGRQAVVDHLQHRRPALPSRLRAKMPSMQKPRWLTLE